MPIKPRPSPAAIKLFVARSGPKAGDPECQAAFQTKDDAIQFLVDLHGLAIEESRRLKRELRMPLKKRLHGAEQCAICEEQMAPMVAQKALTGELYLQDAPRLLTPRKLNKALKITRKIKLRKPPRKIRPSKPSLLATSNKSPKARQQSAPKPAARARTARSPLLSATNRLSKNRAPQASKPTSPKKPAA